jgi:hypothetical protein
VQRIEARCELIKTNKRGQNLPVTPSSKHIPPGVFDPNPETPVKYHTGNIEINQ